MVGNLRKGIPSSDHVLVYDTNIKAAHKAIEQATGTITIADDLAYIAENAVCEKLPLVTRRCY